MNTVESPRYGICASKSCCIPQTVTAIRQLTSPRCRQSQPPLNVHTEPFVAVNMTYITLHHRQPLLRVS